MAITPYFENGKRLYHVYINGFDSRGVRIQRRKKGIETLKKAEAVQFEMKRELLDLKEREISFTWSEWLAECIKRMRLNHRPSTIEGYEGQLKKWINPGWKDLELEKITKQEIFDTIFERIEGVSPYTRKKILKMVRRIFEMAVEEGLLDRNPTAGIRVNVPEVDQKVLTKAEVDIFLNEAKSTSHRFYNIWAMALMTGMRSGELYALKWTDIDLEAGIISVSRQWTNKSGFGPTKTQKSRVVPVSSSLKRFLTELRLRLGNESEFVLPQLVEWQNGEQAKVTRDFCAATEITPVKFHDLRATFITNLLARGESLARVMSIVGHSQIKTTNGYLRKAGVDVKGATESLGYELPETTEAKVFAFKSEA